jgi:hypothetical protein
MKKLLSLTVLAYLGGSLALFGADKTWTGRISDSMCGADHSAMTKEHQKGGELSEQSSRSSKDQECTLACVKSGGKYVFVTGGKVYDLENQDFAGLKEHAGHTVKLTGDMSADGKAIKVSGVSMSGSASTQK